MKPNTLYVTSNLSIVQSMFENPSNDGRYSSPRMIYFSDSDLDPFLSDDEGAFLALAGILQDGQIKKQVSESIGDSTSDGFIKIFKDRFNKYMEEFMSPIIYGATTPEIDIDLTKCTITLKKSNSRQLSVIARMIILKLIMEIFKTDRAIINVDFTKLSVSRRDAIQEFMRTEHSSVVFIRRDGVYTDIMDELK